ncbi:MAG: DUF2275 domain-containing protein [Deltaproteobacteria bacterium]|nr:DUF2275 domain-containing protein [Deltaproteobacteria bacterium]
MTCPEIKTLLPGLLEGILSPEEQECVTSHLASCILCRRVLEDLKETDHLVKVLSEVEPPPFFEQRIMARIREEAGQKRGLLRMLFYPLQIKIPIQAMATILIVVLAFYVFQKSQPEIKLITPLAIPRTESDKGRIRDESLKTPLAPSVAKPTRPAPAVDLADKDHGPLAAAPSSESKGQAIRKAESPPPKEEAPSSSIKQGVPMMAGKEKQIPPPGARALDKAQDRAEKQDSGQAPDTLETGQKLKGRITEPGVSAGESRAEKSAPAASRFVAAPAKKRPAVDLTIQVRDAAVALREIEDRLAQAGGRIIEKLPRADGVFLKAEIPAQKAAAFLEGLKAVGKVNMDKTALDLGEGKTTVSIKIVTDQ